MHERTLSLQLSAIKRPDLLSARGKPLQGIESGKSVQLDREFASPGVVFEPLKERKQSFPYSSFQWCEGNESEVIVMFATHRVIVKGKHLESLPDYFGWQQVRRVRQMGRAGGLLLETGDGAGPIVSEIKIEVIDIEE
jgi:hypothetical protein